MQSFTVALLQMTRCGLDQSAALKKGEAFCRQAKDKGADIALFPEMWNIGYTLSYLESREPEAWLHWQQQAISPSGAFVNHFRTLAKELDMAVAITYLCSHDSRPTDTLSVIDRHGQIVMTQDKVHICPFEEDVLTAGDEFQVCELDTKGGLVRLGSMICFDAAFPESARILMLKGAEVILIPNSDGMEFNKIQMFRTRAYENMVGVAMANYYHPDPREPNGHSLAFDAVAYDETGSARDIQLVDAGSGEAVLTATFNIEAIRDHQGHEANGNAWRRPSRYSLLTSDIGVPPFAKAQALR